MKTVSFSRSILAAMPTAACLLFSQGVLAQTYVEVTPGSAGVTASTHDGNVPANTIDNNLGTRWSASGDGQWIAFDLGSVRTVGYVAIAVYQGNQRRNVFDLQTSNNGTSWTTIWSAESSGTTTGEQTYNFPDVQTRYVRYLGNSRSAFSCSIAARSARAKPSPRSASKSQAIGQYG